ncbi:FAD-containing oxidoreductase [Limibacter armeniacum]|uniref:FAD-containing oxidoreductase n=1 Tax=Limibacter armeniacum TaxID=466084 RepID=UPI002FE528E2
MKKYDSIIIGTGQAGPSMALKLAGKGEKVAIIERKFYGGTCVNNGCTPTKTLIASARAAHVSRNSSELGVAIEGNVKVDMKKVKARKDKIVQESTKGIENALKGMKNLDVYEGHGRFIDAHTIAVGDEQLQADKVYINVGGRARILEGAREVKYLTNSSIMDIDFVPEHLIIIGGSYIGIEFGQMYSRFGSQVTIVEMSDRLIRREDEDVSVAVQEILQKEGVNIRLNAECIKATQKGDKIKVEVNCDEDGSDIIGSHLLLAVGRTPNTDDLGLDKAGIETDQRGFIKVNEQLETNVKGVWALGDCNGKGAFTHTAYNDYEIVADNLLENTDRKVSDRITCYALYMDPPLARVGMNEQQAKESGKKVLKGERPMSRIARAKEKGETYGFMKILVEEDSQKLIGATILGVGGDEVIHSLLDVMYSEKPYTVITHAMHIHPTVSELIPTVLGDLKPLE